LEWSPRLQRPDLPDRRLAGQIEPDNFQFPHRELRPRLDHRGHIHLASFIVNRAIHAAERAQIAAIPEAREHTIDARLHIVKIGDVVGLNVGDLLELFNVLRIDAGKLHRTQTIGRAFLYRRRHDYSIHHRRRRRDDLRKCDANAPASFIQRTNTRIEKQAERRLRVARAHGDVGERPH